jgi:hypothetical protein
MKQVKVLVQIRSPRKKKNRKNEPGKKEGKEHLGVLSSEVELSLLLPIGIFVSFLCFFPLSCNGSDAEHGASRCFSVLICLFCVFCFSGDLLCITRV